MRAFIGLSKKGSAALAVTALLALGGLSTPNLALAQNGDNPMIKQIVVEGDKTIEKGVILANISSRVGAPLSNPVITSDIKQVFQTGYFENVVVETEPAPGGVVLIFRVQERPRVAQIEVKGNKIIKLDTIAKEVSLKIGGIFLRETLERDMAKIRDKYRKEGYLKVGIQPEIKKMGENQVAVTLHLQEFRRIYITGIKIKNTKIYTPVEVKRMMESIEVDCFNWLNNSGKLDEMMVNADLQSITSQYMKEGYIKVFIDKPKITLFNNPEYTKVDIEMSIDEGNQYFTGTVDVDGDLLGGRDDLIQMMGLTANEPYNPMAVNQGLTALQQYYQEQGYAFVQVVPQSQLDEEHHLVNLRIMIRKGEKAYIGRIEVSGNKETRDYVIRREFKVHEQELYNGKKLAESIQDLQALGYFKPSSDIHTEPNGASNLLDVDVDIEESQTGSLQAQISYSDVNRLGMSLGVSKGNLFGRGQTLRFKVEGSETGVSRNIEASFVEPHLFDSDYSSSTSLNYQKVYDQTFQNRGLYQQSIFSQGFGYPLYNRWSVNATLSGTDRTFENTPLNNADLRSVILGLVYNTVNHPIFPTAGSRFDLTSAQTGGGILGGSHEYRRYGLQYQNFTPLNESASLVLMQRYTVGWLETVNHQPIPIEERFYIGGMTSLRGYDYYEVAGPAGRQFVKLNLGPTLTDSRLDSLTAEERAQIIPGGILKRHLTFEMLFPLASETFKGAVFFDGGNVNAESIQYALLKEKEPAFFELYYSYGVGVRMITPMGVVRFEYGIKINPLPGDSPNKFDFTISGLF